jgi:L-ascorbate metabolism protein UlaG (beta-lactamase superfamily)
MKIQIFFLTFFLCLPLLVFSQILNIYSNDGQVQQFQISEIDSMTFSSNVGTMKWAGQASIKIKTNTAIVIYIDPYAGTDYSEPADIILVSHGHSDHNNVSKVTKTTDCKIFSGPGANVGGTKMAAGDSVEVQGIKIKAVEAYNGNHPKGTGVGFVLTLNGAKIYHCGDTSMIPEMALLAKENLDFALLCIDGVYNMGPADAIEVAKIIKAKKVIPMHTGFNDQQKKQNLEKFNPPDKLIMKEGDTIFL